MGMTLLHTEVTQLREYLSTLTHKDFCPLSADGEDPATCNCDLAKARAILEVGTCQVCGCATPCGVVLCSDRRCRGSK